MDSQTSIFTDADGNERIMEIVHVAGQTATTAHDRQEISFSEAYEVRDAKTDQRFPLILEDASFFDETGKQWKHKSK